MPAKISAARSWCPAMNRRAQTGTNKPPIPTRRAEETDKFAARSPTRGAHSSTNFCLFFIHAYRTEQINRTRVDPESRILTKNSKASSVNPVRPRFIPKPPKKAPRAPSFERTPNPLNAAPNPLNPTARHESASWLTHPGMSIAEPIPPATAEIVPAAVADGSVRFFV
jgi:hypothetical protein